MSQIFADYTASITQLKVSPQKVLDKAKGMPVAIISQDKPVAYYVPAEYFEKLLEKVEDNYWSGIIQKRKSETSVEVPIDTLKI